MVVKIRLQSQFFQAPERFAPAPPRAALLLPVTAQQDARRKRKIVLRWIGMGLIAAAVMALIYWYSTRQARAQAAYETGVQLLKIGHYDQAILNFDHTVGLNANMAQAYLMRGEAYTLESRPALAVRDFTAAIRLAPRETAALLERAQVHLNQYDFLDAAEDAGRALQISSALPRAFTIRGMALRGSGDLQAALRDLTRAIELQPNLNHYFERAVTYQKLGQHRLAIADLDRAIEFEPQASPPYFARALSRRAAGDSAGAKEDRETGSRLDGY